MQDCSLLLDYTVSGHMSSDVSLTNLTLTKPSSSDGVHIPAESHRQTEQHRQQWVYTVGHEHGFITPEFSLWEKIRVSSLFCPLLPLRLSMMDLVVAMAPSVDEATMTKTFELIKPYLEVRVHMVSFNVLYISKSKHFLLTLFLMFLDQGSRHAEEGVSCAGGDVRRREGRVQGVCRGQSGNTQSSPARDSEKRIFASKEGETAA